ncbi:hypothetical protein MPLA_680054 [Mesorhizobium sp. ORS 3359]|nr:hypothetical protein MPLA_680054 [Mesorhizobium sp. ORS 3359]
MTSTASANWGAAALTTSGERSTPHTNDAPRLRSQIKASLAYCDAEQLPIWLKKHDLIPGGPALTPEEIKPKLLEEIITTLPAFN